MNKKTITLLSLGLALAAIAYVTYNSPGSTYEYCERCGTMIPIQVAV